MLQFLKQNYNNFFSINLVKFFLLLKKINYLIKMENYPFNINHEDIVRNSMTTNLYGISNKLQEMQLKKNISKYLNLQDLDTAMEENKQIQQRSNDMKMEMQKKEPADPDCLNAEYYAGYAGLVGNTATSACLGAKLGGYFGSYGKAIGGAIGGGAAVVGNLIITFRILF